MGEKCSWAQNPRFIPQTYASRDVGELTMTKIQASPVVYLSIDFSLVQAERALFDVQIVALQGYELSRDGH